MLPTAMQELESEAGFSYSAGWWPMASLSGHLLGTVPVELDWRMGKTRLALIPVFAAGIRPGWSACSSHGLE